MAIPGTSEHQIGLGVDINADKNYSSKDEVYSWLANNAYRYEFIKRYSEDKKEITKVINEPWHYRYVGEKEAKIMHSRNLCLEEYVSELSKNI